LLLIDQHRRIQSVGARSVRVPFVLEPLRYDEARARGAFAAWRTDLGFIQALREELRLCGGTVPLGLPYPDGLIDAGMRAIAGGVIDVARVLPDEVVVTFDKELPSEWYNLDMVVFAGPVILEHFVSKFLNTPVNRQVFEAALEHPAGRGHSTAPPPQHTAGYFGGSADGSAGLAARVAWLLAKRLLALVPRDPSRRLLRLVWIRELPISGPQPSSPVPPPRRATPAPPSVTLVDLLPDEPDDVSPQAQALIDAAEDGTPFCEECARRAAELANA
jgi:hypothetical protein